MKTMQKTKTLNPEMLAGSGIEGSTAPKGDSSKNSMPYGAEKIDDFFVNNYQRLLGWCHSRWNGSGGDVMHSAWELAKKRGYTYINFSFFCGLCKDAARKLRLRQWMQAAEMTIILPPTSRSAERLDAHLATAPAIEAEFPQDCILAARKLMRAEKRGQLNLWSDGGAA